MWYDPSTGQLRDDALDVDAGFIAKQSGLSEDRVLIALEAQQRIDNLLAVVQSEFPDTFVGLYWDEDLRAIAQFKGQAPREAIRILETSGVNVAAELVEYSISELGDLKDAVAQSLAARGVDDSAVALDPRRQVILVTIGSATADGTSPATIANDLRAEFGGSPVEIEVVDGPIFTEWTGYGGGAVGTASALSCTVGFTVISGSTNGVATAGHCGSGLNLYKDLFTGASHSMTYKNGVVGFWGDFEWFTTSGTELDDYYRPTGALYDVSGVKNSFSNGETLFWWGWGTYPTQWTSTVGWTNVSAGGIGHLVCMVGHGGAGGDSGGPVYVGNTSAGFIMGAAIIGGAPRSCFSQSRYIDDAIGVSIKQ